MTTQPKYRTSMAVTHACASRSMRPTLLPTEIELNKNRNPHQEGCDTRVRLAQHAAHLAVHWNETLTQNLGPGGR